MSIVGEADPEKSTAYLVNSPVIELAKQSYELFLTGCEMDKGLKDISLNLAGIEKDPEKKANLEAMAIEADERIKTNERESKENYNLLVKSSANTVVHEIGHLFGLCHTHQYANDSLEEFTRDGCPNIMSYQGVVEGKYGFAFEKEQIEQIQDYLNQGRTFLDMEEFGFNLQDYFEIRALENEFIELEDNK